MKITTNLIKDAKDEWLVNTTAAINSSNQIIDRIMEDDSVELVIMTNEEGSPILTSQMRLTSATNYGSPLHKLGVMSDMCIKELDPLEDILMVRIKTKKKEIMIAPDKHFSIIVIQHGRSHREKKDKKL